MIDTLDKSINFVKRMFGSFFKEAGLQTGNMDLMCALHFDRPHHLHIHFLFWEKTAKSIGKDGVKRYRSKGRISKAAIDNLFVRSGIFVSDGRQTLEIERQTAIKRMKSATQVKRAMEFKSRLKKDIIALAKEIPRDKKLGYNNKEMEPLRERIDEIVRHILACDSKAKTADKSFYKELAKRRTLIEDICGKPYAFSNDDVSLEEIAGKDKYHFRIDPKNIRIVEEIEKDYKRRQGNLVINLARAIKPEIFERDPKTKYKASDVKLKKLLNISDKKITRLFEKFMRSFCFDSEILERDYSDRLQEIEREIKREQEKSEKGDDNYNE